MKYLLILSMIFSVSCSRKKADAPAFIQPVKSVVVYNLSSGRERSFSGVATSSNEVKQSFKVGGTLLKLNVEMGQKVKKGQVLARLDGTDIALKQKEIRSNLKVAESDHRVSSSDYERVVALYSSNNSSLAELDLARSKAEAAKSKIDIINSQLQQVDKQLEYTRITSSVEGSITKVDVEEGENVNPNTPVIYIQSDDNLEVQVDIPESVISLIKKGDSVSVEFSALSDIPFNGRVIKIGVSSIHSSIYPVSIRLSKKDSRIRAGMAATVKFKFKKKRRGSTIVIPSVALGKDDQGSYVYVLVPHEKNFKLQRRNVAIGPILKNGFEIKSGLEDGERVLTAGLSKANDGLIVRLLKK